MTRITETFSRAQGALAGLTGSATDDPHALKRSELKSVFNALDRSHAIVQFDLDGAVLSANRNFLASFGFDAEDLATLHHRALMSADTRDSDKARAFWQSLLRGEPQSGQLRRANKAGDDIWIEAAYNAIPDREGKPAKIVLLAKDVTKTAMESADFCGQIAAISKSQGIAEYDLSGKLLTANANFQEMMGYRLDEIEGKHHSLFVDAAHKDSAEYEHFWESFKRGQYQSGEYQRIAKGGEDVWVRASYNPIFGPNGKPFKVVTYASDVTEQTMRNADYRGQVEAIDKSQSLIEFNMDGMILSANQNFLSVMGYRMEDVKGKHHSIFVDASYTDSNDYRNFWAALGRGEYQAGEFRRVGRDGREIWIQATYNPILDPRGQPFKVVKF
ncbi:MAG: PAS domain-containing protein, partial [Pseudomonadota bacterium]